MEERKRPGKPVALVEVKSTTHVDPAMAKHLMRFSDEFPECKAFLLSLDATPQRIGSVRALYWKQGLQALGL